MEGLILKIIEFYKIPDYTIQYEGNKIFLVIIPMKEKEKAITVLEIYKKSGALYTDGRNDIVNDIRP